MRNYDFENSVGYLFCSTAHLLRKALDDCLMAEGLTSRQWEVLAILSRHGQVPQRRIAELLEVEAPAIAGVVSRMERDGWLTRQACDEDRRRVLISVTTKAEAVWARSVDCLYQMREALYAGVNEADLGAVRRVCGQIRSNLGIDEWDPLSPSENGSCSPLPGSTDAIA